MTVTITASLRDLAGVPDDSPLLFTTTVHEGGDGAIITAPPNRVWGTPIAGVLSIELEPGPAKVTIGDRTYAFTVPNAPADLWDLIAEAVAVPPQTPAQQIAAAVAAYLALHPPGGLDAETVDTAIQQYLTAHPVQVDLSAYALTAAVNQAIAAATNGLASTTSVNAAISTKLAEFVGAVPADMDTWVEVVQAIQNDAAGLAAVIDLLSGKQDKDATLTAFGALNLVADRLVYSTGPDAFALAVLTATARTFLANNSAAGMRTTLQLGNVNNTADADKPISTAAQAALDHLVWTGTQVEYDALPNHTDYKLYGITS